MVFLQTWLIDSASEIQWKSFDYTNIFKEASNRKNEFIRTKIHIVISLIL